MKVEAVVEFQTTSVPDNIFVGTRSRSKFWTSMYRHNALDTFASFICYTLHSYVSKKQAQIKITFKWNNYASPEDIPKDFNTS